MQFENQLLIAAQQTCEADRFENTKSCGLGMATVLAGISTLNPLVVVGSSLYAWLFYSGGVRDQSIEHRNYQRGGTLRSQNEYQESISEKPERGLVRRVFGF